jgi:hypothetical protein
MWRSPPPKGILADVHLDQNYPRPAKLNIIPHFTIALKSRLFQRNLKLWHRHTPTLWPWMTLYPSSFTLRWLHLSTWRNVTLPFPTSPRNRGCLISICVQSVVSGSGRRQWFFFWVGGIGQREQNLCIYVLYYMIWGWSEPSKGGVGHKTLSYLYYINRLCKLDVSPSTRRWTVQVYVPQGPHQETVVVFGYTYVSCKH